MKLIAHLFFTIVGVALVMARSDAVAEALINTPAPQFTLTGADGRSHSLSDYQGKFVVLEWVNPECPFVKKHYNTNNMQSLQQRYAAQGVVWLTISSSAPEKQGFLTPAAAQAFVSERKASPTAILLDHDGKVGRQYNARVTPHLFIIDPKGILIYAGAIDDNDSSRESTVTGAKNFVAAALDEAMGGKPVTTSLTEPYGCSVKYQA